jgi:hypothetical protein
MPTPEANIAKERKRVRRLKRAEKTLGLLADTRIEDEDGKLIFLILTDMERAVVKDAAKIVRHHRIGIEALFGLED